MKDSVWTVPSRMYSSRKEKWFNSLILHQIRTHSHQSTEYTEDILKSLTMIFGHPEMIDDDGDDDD